MSIVNSKLKTWLRRNNFYGEGRKGNRNPMRQCNGYAAPVDAKAIRAEALEEAAKFAYDLRFRCCWTAEAIADGIRGLK